MRLLMKRTTMFLMGAVILIAASLTAALICYAESYASVRIDYRFQDDSVAHDPYVAVFPSGSDVNITVTNPIIPGYKPVTSLEEDADAALTTDLIYDELRKDVTQTVYYVPDLVHYKVRYFKQNIRDDLYTEDQGLPNDYYEKTGYTGDYPAELEDVSFEGFTTLFHEPDFIAADGSTEFKIYYDRNYYLIHFDLDGGYGVDPVYAKYGSHYNVALPKRQGYVFKGWLPVNAQGIYCDEDGDPLLNDEGKPVTDEQAQSLADPFQSGTVPAKDMTYKAVWSAELVDYSIVYLFETTDGSGVTNSNGKNYSVIGARDIKKEQYSGSTVSATDSFYEGIRGDSMANAEKDFRKVYDDMSDAQIEQLWNRNRFDFNTALSTTDAVVNGDGTTRVYAYYDRKVYRQRFFMYRENVNETDETKKYEIAGYTKSFSMTDTTALGLTPEEGLRKHLLCQSGASSANTAWMQIITERPQVFPEYLNREDNPVVVKRYPENENESIYDPAKKAYYAYYYYEFSTKYYDNMCDTWLNHAIQPVPIKDTYVKGNKTYDYSGQYACFGAWSVEWNALYPSSGGTRAYYATHTSNRTVKGIYETLDEELMRDDNDTTLNYLGFWTDAKNADWNGLYWTGDNPDGNKYIYIFNYLNYVQVLPEDEERVARLIESGDDWSEQPSDQSSNTLSGKIKRYIYKNGKYYELHRNKVIETYDAGNQYIDVNKRDKAVKAQQTHSDLDGFRFEEQNTEIDWSLPKDERYGLNVVNVSYFYERETFSLKFRNGNIKNEDETETYYYGESVADSYFHDNEPEYYNPDLKRYFRFEGWYCSPLYQQKVDFDTFRMPDEDVTFYAHWVPVKEQVAFYNDFAAYQSDTLLHKAEVPYNELLLTADVPSLYGTGSKKLTPPSEGATFVGWYYLDAAGTPIRFEPEALPVTKPLKLYAEWSSSETAGYRVEFVEKGTDIPVADAVTGTSFVSKTKSFNAKTNGDLNEVHQWVEGQQNWWPVYPSHSILMEPNEKGEAYAPNIYRFEYIQKRSVWYSVEFRDAATGEEFSGEGFPARLEKESALGVVTESFVNIPGYVPDRVTKTQVLAASMNQDPAGAKTAELRMNRIVFFYTRSEDTALYQVDYMIENENSTDPADAGQYTLYLNDTFTDEIGAVIDLQEIYGSQVSAELQAHGFALSPGMTAVEGKVTPEGDPVVSGESLVIKVYFRRSVYPYRVLYIDYAAELAHPDDPAQYLLEAHDYPAQRVGTTVAVDPPQNLVSDGVPYTRISDRQLSLVIRPEEYDPADPGRTPVTNVLKVYYKKNTRIALSYKITCLDETDDTFAYLTRGLEIVTDDGEIKGSTVITDDEQFAALTREYTFLGWYANPDGTGEPLTLEHRWKPAALPENDTTYYAVFRQRMVSADVRVLCFYGDTMPSGAGDDAFTEDNDGSLSGYTVHFAEPSDYSGGAAPYDSAGYFEFNLRAKTRGVRSYEFVGWYYVGDGGELVSMGDYALTDTAVEPRSQDLDARAVFRRKADVHYKLYFNFTTRAKGEQSFVVKGDLTASEIAAMTDSNGMLELSDEFIMSKAPYESNFGKNLYWSSKEIVRSVEDGVVVARVTAVEKAKQLHVRYRLTDSGEYDRHVVVDMGANRLNSEKIAEISVPRDGFSYWEIRKTRDGEPIAKCYDADFSFCIMDNYFISPVFAGKASPADDRSITLTHLDYTRNRWTDDEGNIDSSGQTDLLYADFEISYNDGGKNLFGTGSGYRTGVAFELCGTFDKDFKQGADYGFVSDPDALKEAILNKKSAYACGDGTTRRIQLSEIPTASLTNKNRVEFGKGYKNAYREIMDGDNVVKQYTNSTYLMKVTAYYVDCDQKVILSNPVYICLKDIAAQDLATKEMTAAPVD